MNRRIVPAFVVVTLAFVAHFAAPACASPVTWEFTGEITEVWDESDRMGGAVVPGSLFSGQFTFESTTPDSDPADPRHGLYHQATFGITGEVSGLPFSGPVGAADYIRVEDGLITDWFDLDAKVDFVGEQFSFYFALGDSSQSIFDNDSLPGAPPSISSLSSTAFYIVDDTGLLGLDLEGEITSVNLVPEPGTLGLLALGIMVVSNRANRRRGS